MSDTTWCDCVGDDVRLGECARCDLDCDDHACPTCKGDGTVNPLTAPAEFFATGTVICPDCDGTREMP